MKINLICDVNCKVCCRYAEFVPSELLGMASKFVLGLRIAFLPIPGRFKEIFLRKNLDKILPRINNYYVDFRIVEAGFSPIFKYQCSMYTRKKRHCELEKKPLVCQARPLDVILPTSIQVDVIEYAYNVNRCLGLNLK